MPMAALSPIPLRGAARPVRARLLLAWFACALLVACADPGPQRPSIAATEPAALGLSDATTALVAQDWWTALGDPALERQMAQALRGHPSLELARARLARAQALAEQHAAAYEWQASVRADVTVQRYSANGITPAPIAGSTRDISNLMLGASLPLGTFERQAADLAAALGLVRAAQADAAAATTLLAAQVGRGYITLARLVAQQDLARRVLHQRRQVAALASERVLAGLDNRIDVTQADAAVADTHGQIEALDEQIALARRLLAAWSGQAPQELDGLRPMLAQLTLEAMPLVVGADLLARRPDVVAARWRVEAAAQDVQLARTRFYPDINLSAFAGLNALGIGKLLRAGSLQAGIMPALHLPLFDGGPLRAQLKTRQAELDAAIAQYNAAVLDAAREAGDAIASERSLQRQVAEQQRALAGTEATLALATRRQAAGLVNYLVVLQAQSPVLAQLRLVTELRARQLDNRIVLMQALGGGWKADPLVAAPLQ